MPNQYFSFKQFTIQQDKCAMKVCTDACLFGAWAAMNVENRKWEIENTENTISNILDIGAGTGLLSLMLAQKVNCSIDAVEIDEHATLQAAENFQASPWFDRLTVHQATIQQFPSQQLPNQSGDNCIKYDFIISNPPFYENELKGPDDKKNIAHHSSDLSLAELVLQVKRLLSSNGEFAILLPYHRTNYFIEMTAQAGFHVKHMVQVKQTPNHNYFRSILWFTQVVTIPVISDIIIKQNNQYTRSFSELLAEYYLHL